MLPTVEFLGKSYDRFYELPEGTIGVIADVYVDGQTVVLQDLSIYAVNHERLDIGVAKLLSIRRLIEADVRQLGYTGIRITGMRLTGASPRREVDVRRRLR